ncbi:MAG TPA: sigma-70 family RNA polymerase sigma factor [Thermoleophilaceae bacterium]|nr:sigma-70 family RNA polymerase sigma factor [Thermoleophilaceae bacterium]
MATSTTTDPQLLEQYRGELTGYCYRMLGSSFEAEDAVQETMLRAWRALDNFEGRAQLRSWLYRIATNVCLDVLGGKDRKVRPMELGEPGRPVLESLVAMRPEGDWILPMPDGRVVEDGADPAEVAAAKETLKLAFVAALQHLPPKQRAVLILREVLRWKASEVASLLDTSEASVNSALQRARATIDEQDIELDDVADPADEEQNELLRRYMDAFERYDMDALTALLAEDATLSMPPYELWLTGQEDIVAWMLGPGHGCEGSKLVPVAANGSIAFGQYRASGPNGEHEPWGLVVIETKGGRISGINTFLDTASLFPLFGLRASPGA